MRFELLKLFARKRTYIGFGAFVVLDLVILFMFNLPGPKAHLRRMLERNGYGFDSYFSGTTLALMVLQVSTVILGSLYLSLVASDLIAKEVEEGTMRMLLCRPVSRLQVTILKYLSAVIYTFILIIFIGLTSLLSGLIFRGYGGLVVDAHEIRIFTLFPAARGLHLYLLSLPMLALSMTTISSIGFLFSCCNMKPAAATILTLSVIFVDFIVRGIPYLESLQSWFITTHLSTWLNIFQYYPPWPAVMEDYSYLIGLDITCLILGSAIFYRRDLK